MFDSDARYKVIWSKATIISKSQRGLFSAGGHHSYILEGGDHKIYSKKMAKTGADGHYR